jgi:succinate dehydrogenase/fumarate reductase flavoprotein subunit
MKQEKKWDKQYDVVVAGYGGAGISTAITAHDNGASVIILEKAPFPGGGQTRTSGIGAAFATNPEGAAEYLYAASSNGLEDADISSKISLVPREDCLIFMKEMANNPAWLTSMGVAHTIRRGTSAGYSKFPGGDSFGHVVIKGWGIQFLETMKVQLDKRGIEVLYSTPAVDLIQDLQTRAIIGVYAMSNGKKMAIKAKKGVVLCTGGFEFDEEMKANYLRPFPLKFSGWPYNTGDGIKMAQRVGADLWHMNTMVGYLNIWVPEYKAAWLLVFGRGIWVNKYGWRYTDEGVKIKSHNWWLKHSDFNLEEPGYADLPTYLIFDETIRKQGPISANSASGDAYLLGIQAYPAALGGCPEGWSQDNMREIEKGWIKKGDTIEELGRLIGGKMDPATLKETVSKYNSYCEQGHDPEFGRGVQSLKPLVTPPFYSCILYPGGINTCGGPRRNAYGQVLDPYKKAIPRLYSAGEMGSICGNIYAIGGLNAGEMLASGRLAGKSVAALKDWDSDLVT